MCWTKRAQGRRTSRTGCGDWLLKISGAAILDLPSRISHAHNLDLKPMPSTVRMLRRMHSNDRVVVVRVVASVSAVSRRERVACRTVGR
jgi:hypothetical protein